MPLFWLVSNFMLIICLLAIIFIFGVGCGYVNFYIFKSGKDNFFWCW